MSDDESRRSKESEQRRQQREQQQQQEEHGIRPSPPPYEVAETPLERLDLGLAYMFGIVAASFLVNLLILALIAAQNGG
jgi:hypothetical protein